MYPNGIRDVFRELMAKEGIFALYKGVTPVMLRAFPANGVSYEFCLKQFEIPLIHWGWVMCMYICVGELGHHHWIR